MLTIDQKRKFDSQGFLNVRGLFSVEEVQRHRQHYMEMRLRAPIPATRPASTTVARIPSRNTPA